MNAFDDASKALKYNFYHVIEAQSRRECSSVYAIQFDPRAYDDQLWDFYGIAAPLELFRWARVRRAEHLAGRLSANWALAGLGNVASVGRGLDGAPIWPAGVVGSISHSRDVAIAVVAPSTLFDSIGIDVEDILNTDSEIEVRNFVLSPSCFAILEVYFCPAIITTLVLSSKESVFKALCSIKKFSFDFSALSIADISMAEKVLTFKLDRSLLHSGFNSSIVRVNFRIDGARIFTCCEISVVGGCENQIFRS